MRILKNNESINYWCTWLSQNKLFQQHASKEEKRPDESLFEGDQGAKGARDILCEQTVFGENGFALQWNEEIRSRLLFMFDDGWDVEYNTHPDKNLPLFGSLQLSKQRFPSLKGNNAERLKKLTDEIKRVGWKGIGFWVAAQPCSPMFADGYDEKELKEYYAQRILESKYAGVTYWKVDWGKYEHSVAFRRLLTDLGRELYPELLIEHASCCPPINGIINECKIRYADDLTQLKRTVALCDFADVFRSYDVTDDKLSAASTLDRLSEILHCNKGFTNCEDEVLIGAALGCALGVMRSAYASDTNMVKRLSEVTAALRWQQIAPPFAGGKLKVSADILVDECLFEKRETWYSPIIGKITKQAAPAVMARNTELPEIAAANALPYVIASKNPNGVYSVAAVKRYKYGNNTSAPSVLCNIDGADKVGVFGDFDVIKIAGAKARRIVLTNLYTNERKDVTHHAHFDNGTLILPIKPFADFVRSNDLSQPAYYLTLSN